MLDSFNSIHDLPESLMVMEKLLRIFSLVILLGTAQSQLNLASNGTASQSSTYPNHHAQLAIIGGPTHEWSTGSCSATALEKRFAWWMLTFSSETVFISNVVIHYRRITPNRLAGYSLYITNSSISSSATSPPNDGHLCYHHEKKDLPNLVQNIKCDHLGKRVIIYNERKTGVTYPKVYSNIAILELCDVQIIGCYKSWWGGGCRKPCPDYCTDHHCDPINGTCIWGCSYKNCLNNECYNDGTCTTGCIKGQGGLFCNDKTLIIETVSLTSDTPNQQSSLVTDGDKRGTSCLSLSSNNSRLEIDTGELRLIQTINVFLKDGHPISDYVIFVSNTSDARQETLKSHNNNIVKYTHPFHVHVHNLSFVIGRYLILVNTISSINICEVEIIGCQTGFYGNLCDKKCPLNCDRSCHQESGHCILGCKDGYTGSTCDEECAPSKFGRSCSETCHCVHQPCYYISGTCPYDGCHEGWTGSSCSQEGISMATTGVSLPVFVSVVTSIFGIFVVAIMILLIFYRRKRTPKTEKYEDLHHHSTSNNKTEQTENAYELG